MIRVCGGQHISALPLQRGCMSSKCQLVTQSFQQQWKPFEDEAEYEKPRLQWCQRTAASASALIAGSSCNQKLAGIKKAAKWVCGVFGLFEAGLWRNYNHICSSQWAGDEKDLHQKKKKSAKHRDQKTRTPLATRGFFFFRDVFAGAYFRCTARMRGNG